MYDIQSMTFDKINHNNIRQLGYIFHNKKHIPKKYIQKLGEYIHIDNIIDLMLGRYIKWVSYETKKMSSGGILLNTSITNSGILLFYKTIFGTVGSVIMSSCIVFQKLTNQELIIIDALSSPGLFAF